MRRTARGFLVYSEFKDNRGSTIRVQESSAAMHECVWIFTEDAEGREAKEHLGQLVSTSPHLTKAQARRLAKALLKFAGERSP